MAVVESLKVDNEVVRELRSMASQSTSVRQLVELIQRRLALGEHEILPILWYFTHAFCLALPKVLPIREWLGTNQDEQIDALILPEINNAKERWIRPLQKTVGIPQ
jgi:hypothetical protein